MSLNADVMVEALRPIAADGNPHATLALLRLAWADAPDSEAELIHGEWSETWGKLRPFFDELARVFGPYLPRGV